jgi:hypothetical protein
MQARRLLGAIFLPGRTTTALEKQVFMENRTAHFFIFDGFGDWEPASAVVELHRTFGFVVKTVGLTRNVVTTMGGIRVLPDLPWLS